MDTNQHSPEDFSLSEGGPFNRALEKMHLNNKQGKIAVAGFVHHLVTACNHHCH